MSNEMVKLAQRLEAWEPQDLDAIPMEALEFIDGLQRCIDEIKTAFAANWGPDGWDNIYITEEIERTLRAAGFVDDRTPGFADPNDWCWDGDHRGPIVYSGSEPIDGGVGIYFKCETCGRSGDSSVDINEINWTSEEDS